MRESPAAEKPLAGRESIGLLCLREQAFDTLLLSAMDRMYRMDYAGADSLIKTGIPPGAPAHAYFRGLILFNRFNDLGDTAALTRAAAWWEGLENPRSAAGGSSPLAGIGGDPALYRGLARLQLSYVAKLRGHSLQAARLGRQAALQLSPLSHYAEAEAALALYGYYKAALLKGMDWLPFMRVDSQGPLHRLEQAIPRSRYLAEAMQVSLLWLYYDAGGYDQGLRLIDGFLARYPRNRLYRQIKADFLFRKGEYAGARDLHEDLQAEYARLRKVFTPPAYIPIGYLSSVGNLAKIHAAMGNRALCREQAAIWSASESQAYRNWLPASLKREVKSLPTP